MAELRGSLHNKYNFTEKLGIEEIEVDSNWLDVYYTYSKEELKQLYDEGTIYEVIRN